MILPGREHNMMPLIKFGIIGCGQIAQRHASRMQERGQLLAVCDIVQEKAEQTADRYKAIPFFTTVDLLRMANETGINVIAVCSPNGWHARHVIQALEAGVHVVCEKPMAISSADCQKMMAAAKANDRHLFIVKQNRFNPPVIAVKQLLEAGKLGKIYSIQVNCCWNRPPAYYAHSWHGTRVLDGGTLFTQFSHFIDLLYWLFGNVKTVDAILANAGHKGIIETEDSGVVLFEFDSGAIGALHYTVNSYEKNMEGSVTVVGEHGTVKIGGQYLNELEYEAIKDYSIPEPAPGKKPNEYGFYKGSMSNHDKVYDNVVAVLQGREEIATGMEEGAKTVEIIEKIYQTARWV